MTVGELIDILMELDENKPVSIHCTYDLGFKAAGGRKIDVFDEDGEVELWNDET